MAIAFGNVLAPILGGWLVDQQGFQKSADIMAAACLLLCVVYFLVMIVFMPKQDHKTLPDEGEQIGEDLEEVKPLAIAADPNASKLPAPYRSATKGNTTYRTSTLAGTTAEAKVITYRT